MNAARRSFVARRPALSRAQIDARWAEVLRLAALVADVVRPRDRAEHLQLMNQLRDLSPAGFPVKHYSALKAAEAFLAQARGFAAVEVGEIREALAPALQAAASACAALIDMETRARSVAAQAAISRRLGEANDD